MLEPSRINDPADGRRVRALVVDLLEQAAAEGHTLLPRSWVIRRARERALQPPCPLGEKRARRLRGELRAGRSASGNPARASQPTKWTGSSSAARSSVAR